MTSDLAEPRIEIAPPRSVADVESVKALFVEYAEFLGVDLCFQGFAEEIAAFPATYESLLLANVGGEPAAAVGLKRLDAEICEMKRLYARPAFRGLGLGRRLCEALIEDARRRGYATMRLDTLKRLEPAITLYRWLGFTDIPRYYDNPLSEVVYMELPLRVGAPR